MSNHSELRTALGVAALIPSIVVFLLVSIVIHEAGHALMALVLGIPFDEIELGWYALGPGIKVPETTPVKYLPYFRYSGGFFAAAVLLAGYLSYVIFQRKKIFRPRWWSKLRWWYAYPILLPVAFNLFAGYFEGSHFNEYVTGELPSEMHYLVIILAPLLINAVVTLLFTARRRVADERSN